jgi:hypothetical protein
VKQVDPEIEERARHDELAAAHRKIEEEQQDALAAMCAEKSRTRNTSAACRRAT